MEQRLGYKCLCLLHQKEIFLRNFLELPNGIPPKVAQDTWSALYHELGHDMLSF